ncbi:MAG: hypothetical protein K0S67_1827 [Nitrososphaeraceae archaeon]|nr:hypothetical protein [Nitrososphaeraceae archaeon]
MSKSLCILLHHMFTLNAQRRLKYSVFSAQYIGDVIGSFVMTKVIDTPIRRVAK